MKTKRLFIYCLLAGTFFLASCSNEDMTDNQVETLPEGLYPLTFTATQGEVVASPQTRVSDSDVDGQHKSSWTAGDQIEVKVSDNNSNTMETTCTLDVNGNITNYNPQLYWQTTGNYTVDAWYSNISGQNTTNSTVNLADQSSGLAYVLADKQTNKKYQSGSLSLTLRHKLAKVRVKLEGTTTTDLTNATVKIKNQYIGCSIDKGVVKGTDKGTITMHKPTTADGYYEANIVPGTLATDCFEITAGGKTVSATITTVNATAAGSMYSFTITVDKPGTLRPVNGVFTVNEGDNVTIAENYSGTEPIVVNGDATITISNVKLTTNSNVMTINNGAKVTLVVNGTDNIFTSTDGAGIKIMEKSNYAGGSSEECGSITINGTDAKKSKLKITATSGAAIGFRMYGHYGTNWTTTYCGDITIGNITLEVEGGSGSPAIGISSVEVDYYFIPKEFGMITIEKSIVNASSTGGAACIGTPKLTRPCPFVLKGISINSSTITATVTGSEYQAACIGFGYTIVGKYYEEYENLKKKITKIEFSNSTLNLTTENSNKVGFGDGDSTRELTEGIWNNGSKVGDTTWNP